MYMADPVYSPDGKFMWTGSEWIPAPPAAEPEPAAPSEQALNMQDSVIGGAVVHSTVINNDPAAVTTAVIAALQQMGMVNRRRYVSPRCQTPSGVKHLYVAPFGDPNARAYSNTCV